jgi:glycosyltransferase involved in cell wall biosynthesis
MKKNNPDILICTLNSIRTIEGCITAARREFPDSRIIVVDGGSIDGTIEFVKNQLNIELNVEPNLSLAESRFFGFGRAKNEFVLQLDSDVILHKGVASTILSVLESFDQSTAAYEFGVNDYIFNAMPSSEMISSGEYEKRAFYFATLVRPSMFTFENVSLRHLEEEYARRMLLLDGKKWNKTGKIIGDHYSSPNRYGGAGLNIVVRGRPFPEWTFYDEGKLDSLTKVSIHLAPIKILKIIARVLNYQLFFIWLKSVGNPFSAVKNYILGRFSANSKKRL